MTIGSFGPQPGEALPPLYVQLSGFDLDDNVVGPVQFEAKRRIQGQRLMRAVTLRERGTEEAVNQIIPWIRDCMKDEAEQIRFAETIDSENFIVEMEALAEIFVWLIEQYTNRPTSPSAVLQNGPSNNSPISTDGSPLPAPPTPTSSTTPAEPSTSFIPPASTSIPVA